MITPSDSQDTTNAPSPFLFRAATALLQACVVYLLLDSAGAHSSWPATHPTLFVPSLLVAIYVPLIVLLGLGNLGGRALAIWAILASMILVTLGYHDATRGRFLLSGPATYWPRYALWLTLTPALFIANVLVTDASLERRPFPSYTLHFDTAWKQGMQLVFTLVFVGLFWGVLHLGASLFSLIRIDFLKTLIGHLWFSCPATTLAVAAALHVTDVQPSLLRSARSLALTLFSWLLPLLALLVLGFLVSLPFVSLVPLWHTHFATSLLLSAEALLIFLINCWYQDGGGEPQARSVKCLAAGMASLQLPVLAGLAIGGLLLRVRQYGWTEERVFAAALVAVAACYAVGYALSRPWTGRRLPLLERTNFLAAYLMMALVLALFTVVADPARIMVGDQVARLESGTIPIDKFDFAALKFDGARWGKAALEELSKTQDLADAAIVNDRAAKALAQTNRSFLPPKPPTAADFTDHVTIWPAGHTVPPKLSDMITGAADVRGRTFCLQGRATCVLRFLMLGSDDHESALLVSSGIGLLYTEDANGNWKVAAMLSGTLSCPNSLDAFRGGNLEQTPHPWPDLQVAGQRFSFLPEENRCP